LNKLGRKSQKCTE